MSGHDRELEGLEVRRSHLDDVWRLDHIFAIAKLDRYVPITGRDAVCHPVKVEAAARICRRFTGSQREQIRQAGLSDHFGDIS